MKLFSVFLCPAILLTVISFKIERLRATKSLW